MKKKVLLILLTVTCFQLNSQTIVFDGDIDSDWNKAANWVGDVLPSASNDVDLDGNTVVLSASTTVQRVFAGSSSNLTINSGQTLTITGFVGGDDGLELNDNAVLVNNGTIAISDIHIADTNADGIYNRGTITNNGSITIDGTGQHGIYMQRGTFTNNATGTLTITNYGQGDTGADGIHLDDSSGNISNFINSGNVAITMTGSDDGIYINDGSIINNTGMFTIGGVAGDNGIRIDDTGAFNNNAGGLLTINSTPDDQIFLDSTGTFGNTGTVNLNNAADVGLYVTDQGVFTNNFGGNVNINSATNFSIQVDANSSTANISNTGNITTTGGGTDGLRLQENGSFTNNSGGSLAINQPTGEGIRFESTAGILTNSGIITITGSGSGISPGDNGIEVSGGTLTNTSGAMLTIINIFDKGILTNAGIINNTGTINISNTGEEGVDMNTGGTFNNNTGGVLFVNNDTTDGLEINTGCSVINDGHIQLTRATDASGRDDIEFNGGTFTNNSNATFNPGTIGGYGELEVRGAIDLGSSTVTFDIGGTTHTSTFDRIEFATSSASLETTNATANLNWGSYVPSVGDTFKIVDGSGTVNGTFATITSTNSDIVTTFNYATPGEVIVEVININTTWTGNTSTNWDTVSNWSTIVPTATTDVIIPDLANDPVIGPTTAAVANDITTNNVLTISSGGSLIVKGTPTGNVTYQVSANDTNWHLLSSPVVGAAYNGTWIDDNDIDNTTRTVGTNVAIATYTNTTDADGDWNYATDASNTGTFITGQGYAIKKDATTNSYVAFNGSLKTDNLMSTITQNTGVNNWNLVGNPYTAYVLVSDLVASNTTNLTGTHQTVYVYDNNKSGGAGYVALTGTDYIHPGQGFFVNAANSTMNNFTIDATQLSHQTGVTLYKNTNLNNLSIKLIISEGDKNDFTTINYESGKTTSLDPSFDIGTFTGVANNFSVYSHLVSNSEGVDFTRQSLPNSEYENMVIPIGVKALADKEITFSAEAINLPKDLNVYLEDRLLNTFTKLEENSTYKVILSEDTTDGRFFLHTKSASVLNTEDAFLDSVSIFRLEDNTLRISGLQKGNTTLSIFSTLGNKVFTTSFEATNSNDISLPQMATGVYIVNVKTLHGKLSKKIVVE